MVYPPTGVLFVLLISHDQVHEQVISNVIGQISAELPVVLHHARKPGDLLSGKASSTPYQVILLTPECSAWLSLELQEYLSTYWPTATVIKFGSTFPQRPWTSIPLQTMSVEESVRLSLWAIFEQQYLKSENQELQSRLNYYEEELHLKPEQPETTAVETPNQDVAYELLLSRIRHEVNNPLTGVLGQTQLLLRRTEILSEETRRRLEIIEKLTLRISEVFKNFEAANCYLPSGAAAASPAQQPVADERESQPASLKYRLADRPT